MDLQILKTTLIFVLLLGQGISSCSLADSGATIYEHVLPHIFATVNNLSVQQEGSVLVLAVMPFGYAGTS